MEYFYPTSDSEITISASEYKRMVRAEHANDIIVRLVDNENSYIEADALRLILGIPSAEEQSEEDSIDELKQYAIDALESALADLKN